MKKSIVLGLLGILSVGMLAGSAEARPRDWRNCNNNRAHQVQNWQRARVAYRPAYNSIRWNQNRIRTAAWYNNRFDNNRRPGRWW